MYIYLQVEFRKYLFVKHYVIFLEISLKISKKHYIIKIKRTSSQLYFGNSILFQTLKKAF